MKKSFCEQFQKEFTSLKENKALLDIEFAKSQKEYDRDRLKALRRQIDENIYLASVIREILYLGKPKSLRQAGENVNSLKQSFWANFTHLEMAYTAADMDIKAGDIELLRERFGNMDMKRVVDEINQLPLAAIQLSLIAQYLKDSMVEVAYHNTTDVWSNIKSAIDNLLAESKELALVGKISAPTLYEEVIRAIQNKDVGRLEALFKTENVRDPISSAVDYMKNLAQHFISVADSQDGPKRRISI